MVDLMNSKVKDIVTGDHRAASVFEKYSIDFCCNGGQTVGAACAERGVDIEALIADLAKAGGAEQQEAFRPQEWGLGALIDHIIGVHHDYVRRMIPVLEAHVGKILAVHGERHPELHAIAQNVGTVTAELNDHMVKEERILFPYIRMLVDAEAAHRAPEPPPFGSIANPIAMMEREHLSAGDALFAVRRLSNGYVPPADGCTTYRVTLTELEEFELDLHRHVHLENNILFPRAIALETLLRPAETISRNA